jgi:phosphorylcholine metabolism protein LicD
MKIELKLKADEINYLDSKTRLTMDINPNDLLRDKKTAYSIMLDVSDKLHALSKKVNRSVNLFDEKKQYKISLKWHEAEVLEQYIDAFSSYQDDEFSKNIARKVIGKINQKLA